MTARLKNSILICGLASVLLSPPVAAEQSQDLDRLDDILSHLENNGDNLHFERYIDGQQHIPQPKRQADRISRSYFEVNNFQVFKSLSGRRVVLASITNHSGGGVRLNRKQIKALFTDQRYISPLYIDKGNKSAPFAIKETRTVNLDFGQHASSIVGILSHRYGD